MLLCHDRLICSQKVYGNILLFRWNARRNLALKSRLSLNRNVSRRKFNFITEDQIKKLQQINLKKKTASKCNWAVTAFTDWREECLRIFHYDYSIYTCDLNNLATLTKGNLSHALCRFIPEVTKKRGQGPYPGKTMYQMVIAIQKYLLVNRIKWDLVEGTNFLDVKTVLDNVMREQTEANIGVVPKRAEVITYEFEEKMWNDGVLGEDTPDKLRHTVLFLIGVNLMLRVVEEHNYLCRNTPVSTSQLSFHNDENGQEEDCVTKTHDGGLHDMPRDRKEV